MLAYLREICPHCGGLQAICSDPSRGYYPQRSYCYAQMTIDYTWRRFREQHKDADGLKKPLPTDGLTIWASTQDLTPEDNFVR